MKLKSQFNVGLTTKLTQNTKLSFLSFSSPSTPLTSVVGQSCPLQKFSDDGLIVLTNVLSFHNKTDELQANVTPRGIGVTETVLN